MTENRRPPCEFEREAGDDYTCRKDHCPRCGEHPVWSSPTESRLRCELQGGCQIPLEAFA